MAEKRAQTTKIGGGADYAKVAERLVLFREDNHHGKHESDYEFDADGQTVFKVWLWNDKAELLDLMKAGVTDINILRSSADSNGTAKGKVGVKDKDFEKLESIALGRALANLGYMASGEIASSEEMDEFNRYKEEQKAEAVKQAIITLQEAKTLDELKAAFIATNLMSDPKVVAAKDECKAKLTETKA
jgi:hypothetical protein